MDDLQLHLIHCDITTIDASWNIRDVRSSFWRLYINNRDGASLRCSDGVYALPGTKVHLIPAYFLFTCQNQRSIRHLYFHFDLLGLTPLLQKSLFTKPISLPTNPLAKRIWRQYAAGERPTSSPSLLCLTQSLILQSMSHIFNRLGSEQRQRLATSLGEAHPVRPAIQLVEQRLPDPLKVSEMANACGMSEDHFIRRFRATVGQTPGRYVLQRRIALAARRLLYGTDSIDAIAMEHGFANRFHFTRAFTREMGTSPAAYRTSTRV